MCTDRLEGTIFPHLEQHKFLRLVMVVFSCVLGGFNLKNGLCLSGSIPLAGANKVPANHALTGEDCAHTMYVAEENRGRNLPEFLAKINTFKINVL